jgi:GT2 family glycosyltransferase
VVVCTRERPEMLRAAVASLAAQSDRAFQVLVVEQGARAALDDPVVGGDLAVRVLADGGTGLSRARNLAWRSTEADWLVFLDDDCALEPDWIGTFRRVLASRRGCCMISGQVIPAGLARRGSLPCGVVRIRADRVRGGRWQRPLSLGGGSGVAIRRSMIAALGGWDERLGAGAARFPSAEDEDFNYRLLRAGGTAFTTPALRSHHLQWRSEREIAPVFGDYMTGRAGVASKHLRSGDPVGGTWLLALATLDCAKLVASVLRYRQRCRLRIGWFSLRGLVIGLTRGLRVAW